jgi:predicted MFS family arabinose efflux permease
MAILLVTTAGLFGALFLATFYLQDVLRLDPLATGLRVLPMTALMVLGAPVAGAVLRGYGPRRVAIAGTTLVVAGIAALSRLGPASPWLVTGATFAVLGLLPASLLPRDPLHRATHPTPYAKDQVK